MRRSLFLLVCAIAGIATLAALWPPRATTTPAPVNTPPVNTAPLRSSPIVLPTDPIRGERNAPLSIIEFSDFSCPHCADIDLVLAELRQQYGARLQIVWKDLPILDRITDSRRLHIAARCAQEQGKFWEYHDALFRDTPTDDDGLLSIAQNIGLNASRFGACMSGMTADALVSASEREARDLGITATPTLYMNGQKYMGDLTRAAISAVLDVP